MKIRLIHWDVDAWKEYCDWQKRDKSVVKRINRMIKEIERSPFDGMGKNAASDK